MKYFQLVVLFLVAFMMMPSYGMKNQLNRGQGLKKGANKWAQHQGSDVEAVKAAILSEVEIQFFEYMNILT